MKVFISHDSRDKNRFVKDFAHKLLENGVDVWYDDWELGFGDSLMTIFDAISQCDVFISVISEYSIESKWVKEESDSVFMKKIENNVKFIPIILPGDFEIPAYMNHVLQCRIENIDDYDDEFNRILSSIFGISLKPKIGNAPRYTLISPINELEQSDTIILKVMGDFLLKTDVLSLSFEKIVELTEDFDINDEEVKLSLEILKDMNLCDYTNVFGTDSPVNIKLLYNGSILYCKNYVDDFRLIVKEIFSSILNDNIMDEKSIIQKTKIKRFIVKAILECLESNKYITMTKTFNGAIIHKISAIGKRYMKRILGNSYEETEYKSEIILPECNKKETSIFKDLCQYCLDKSFDAEIDPMVIMNLVDQYYEEEDFDKLQERIAYSLRNLEKNNYITTNGGSIGMAFSSKSITTKGFCFYLTHFMDGKKIYSNIIKAVYEDKMSTIDIISEKYSIACSIVEALIKIFRKKGYIACRNDLTDITLTPGGEEYFEEILFNSL